MTKRTRLFMFVAVGILVGGLGTGLVASYMGLENLALIGSDGPNELDYIPADTRAIAYANVREVMDSELRQKLLDLHPGQDVPDFTKETGIDPRTDIDEVVVALFGPAGEDRAPVVLARGRFNTSLIESFVRQHGATVEDYKGIRLLVHGTASGAIAFVEPGLVAAGTPASVKLALDTKAAGANVRSNDDVMRLMHNVDDGNAWAVARFDALTGAPNLPPEISQQLPPINWFAASGHINGGIRAVLHAEAKDEAAGNSLREVIRGFIALARLQTGQRPEFADLLNSFELGGEGKTVSLGFALPPEVIEALGALHAQRPRVPVPAPAPEAEQPQAPAL